MSLDALGAGRSEERSMLSADQPSAPRAVDEFPGDVIEVALSTSAGRYAAAWVARDTNRVTVHSVLGSVDDLRAGRPLDHGAVAIDAVGVRGVLGLGASRSGDFSLIHRGQQTDCPEDEPSETPCVEVKPKRLGVDAEQGIRDGVVLTLPRPCIKTLLGFVSVRDDWYYGVCGRGDSVGQSTVFALRFDPEYAHPETMFSETQPLALTEVLGGVLGIGKAGEELRAMWVGDAGRSTRRFAELQRSVRCIDGIPAIELASASEPTLQILMRERRGGLAALLPDEIAGEHARAIWTGEALLVARPAAGEVGIHRYQCEHGELLRTNPI